MGEGPLGLMASFTYTQADLAGRVIARLSEVGISTAAGAGGAVVPPSADRSLEALNRRALMKLGEIGFGQDAEPEAAERIRDASPNILAELVNRRIYAPITEPIAPEAFDPLATILAARVGLEFGVPSAELQTLAALADSARKALIAIGLPARVQATIPAILAELYTDRVYAFPVDDYIRPDAFDGLAAIISARLASDIAPDRAPLLAQEAAMAETRLRRMRAQPAPSRTLATSYF